LTNCD